MFRPDPNINAKLRAAVQEGVNAYMLVIARAMRAELSKPGGGRLYRRSNARIRAMRKAKTIQQVEAVERRFRAPRNLRESGFHRASRPGQPPAVDTGMLRRSWQIGRGQLRGQVGGTGSAAGSADTGGRVRKGPNIKHAIVTPLNDGRRIGYRYGSAVRYARIDKGYGRVAARPYIKPTMDTVRDLFEPTMAVAMQRHFGGPPR